MCFLSTSLPGRHSRLWHPLVTGSTQSTTIRDDEYAKRKYVCAECHRRFLRPSSLRTHLIVHTGNKPYECPIVGCAKRYSTKSNMKRHARSHRCNDAHSTAGLSTEQGQQHIQHSFARPEPSKSAVHYGVLRLSNLSGDS
ncbi:hypothetical protein PHLGIDRAFT_471984 [Phlebiopsis gigantea 11061_1 CR5-6]|uniref:C2H2-type domain-containing protein n=1 Tax=Phlebiopsis gigantea (strain 11061_1 CR5-6) TaxID=745531 RepID=A0A0C3PJ37_PHLG1|nr:hypothetical protein PHLGIDRAFT_471984 [Phlebiopsis gigantea 11061_1 CR5-6]